mmetsp:Transcript_32470/g.31726  ORF Transcript_32470/g.31726 Transcript_32470/m.31726 type:complete len:119 (+) Transcript_32470:280-636(+)
MEKNGWNQKKYLVDGFPRNQDNQDGWTSVMGSSVEVPLVLYFEAQEEELTQRILLRSQSSGRNDDNIESLKKRFTTFEEQTKPIVNYYESLGKVRKINGLGNVEEVYAQVIEALGPLV